MRSQFLLDTAPKAHSTGGGYSPGSFAIAFYLSILTLAVYGRALAITSYDNVVD